MSADLGGPIPGPPRLQPGKRRNRCFRFGLTWAPNGVQPPGDRSPPNEVNHARPTSASGSRGAVAARNRGSAGSPIQKESNGRSGKGKTAERPPSSVGRCTSDRDGSGARIDQAAGCRGGATTDTRCQASSTSAPVLAEGVLAVPRRVRSLVRRMSCRGNLRCKAAPVGSVRPECILGLSALCTALGDVPSKLEDGEPS